MDDPERRWPTRRGFDRFFGTLEGAGSLLPPAHPGARRRPTSSTRPSSRGWFYTDAISDNAVQFLDEHERGARRRPVLPLPVLHRAALAAARARGGHRDATRVASTPAGTSCARSGSSGSSRRGSSTRRGRSRRATSACRPGRRSSTTSGRPRRMETYAAQVDRMDQGIGRVLDAARGRRPARQHAGGVPLRQRRLRRGDAAGGGRPRVRDRLRAAAGDDARGRAGGAGQRPRRSVPGPSRRTCPTAGRGPTCPTRRSGSTSTGCTRAASPPPSSPTGRRGCRPTASLCRVPSQLVDVLPTIADAAGADYPRSATGTTCRPWRA